MSRCVEDLQPSAAQIQNIAIPQEPYRITLKDLIAHRVKAHGKNTRLTCQAVPYRIGVEVANRYKNCELVTIVGDDHCYERHLDQVVAAVKDWAMRQL